MGGLSHIDCVVAVNLLRVVCACFKALSGVVVAGFPDFPDSAKVNITIQTCFLDVFFQFALLPGGPYAMFGSQFNIHSKQFTLIDFDKSREGASAHKC